MSNKKIRKVSSKKVQKSKTVKAKKKSAWSIFQATPSDPRDAFIKKLFWIAFSVMSIFTLAMALETGLNEDEKYHQKYIEGLDAFYSTFGEDKRATDLEFANIVVYGGFMDVITIGANKILGFEESDIEFYSVRHFLIALIGLLGILFTGLLGRILGGWRTGFAALLIIFLTPRFLGHVAINPRDIPFAAGYTMSIYFMIRFFQSLPKVPLKVLIGLILGMALTIGTRSGGFLLYGYFGLFGLLHFLWCLQDKRIANDGLFMRYLKYGLIVALASFVLALLFWPFGLSNPIENVQESLRQFSNFKTVIRVLFGGQFIWSSEIASQTYIFTWLSMALPSLLLLGLLLFVVFIRGGWKRYNKFYLSLVLFGFLFPILYIIIRQSNLYTGMRHLLFIVPMLAVLAALGWDYLYDKLSRTKNNKVKWAAVGAFTLFSIFPLTHIISQFSTCYVYFNELSNGRSGAFGNYESDYWGISIKQAFEWMEDQGLFEGDEPMTIGCNSNFVLKKYVAKYPHVKVGYSRFREMYETNWDYAIYTNFLIDGGHLRSSRFKDNNLVHVIGSPDAPVGMIYKNTPERWATNGHLALKNNNAQEAIGLFEQEIQRNPNNASAQLGLGKAYFNSQQLDKAVNAFEELLAINPDSHVGLLYGGLSYLNTGKLNEAMRIFSRAVELNQRDANALYYQGVIYSRQGDMRRAIETLQSAIEANPRQPQAYQLLIQLFNQQGNTQQANYFQQLMRQYTGQ